MHDAPASNNMILPETETDRAISAEVVGINSRIFRSFFDFDLSTIPASATIVSCNFAVRSYGASSCSACIQEGTQTGDPVGYDYSAFIGLLFDSRIWVGGTNVFTPDSLGQAYIQSKFGGTAKLCMREYNHDYLNVEPSDGEDFHCGLYWSNAAEVNRPKLTIKYIT